MAPGKRSSCPKEARGIDRGGDRAALGASGCRTCTAAKGLFTFGLAEGKCAIGVGVSGVGRVGNPPSDCELAVDGGMAASCCSTSAIWERRMDRRCTRAASCEPERLPPREETDMLRTEDNATLLAVPGRDRSAIGAAHDGLDLGWTRTSL